MDVDKLAEQLYASLIIVVGDRTGIGLLAALGDIRAKVPYNDAAPKTRGVFRELANNLTRIQAKG